MPNREKKKSSTGEKEKQRQASKERLAKAISPKHQDKLTPVPTKAVGSSESRTNLGQKKSKENIQARPKRSGTQVHQQQQKHVDSDDKKDLSFAAAFACRPIPSLTLAPPNNQDKPEIKKQEKPEVKKQDKLPPPTRQKKSQPLPKAKETKPDSKKSDRNTALPVKPKTVHVPKVEEKKSKEAIKEEVEKKPEVAVASSGSKEKKSNEKIVETVKEKSPEIRAPKVELLEEKTAISDDVDSLSPKPASKSSPSTNDDNSKTVFERISGEVKPFVATMHTRTLLDEKIDDDAPTKFEKITGVVRPAPVEKPRPVPSHPDEPKQEKEKEDEAKSPKSPSADSPPRAMSVYMPVHPSYAL